MMIIKSDMMASLVRLVCLMMVVESIQGVPDLCLNSLSDCYVQTSVTFTQQTQYTYSQQLWTITNYDFGKYDSVIQWIPDTSRAISFFWQFFAVNPLVAIDCSGTKLWINGTLISATQALRGMYMNETYCYFDIDGMVPSSTLSAPAQSVYFLFNNTIAVGESLQIDEDSSSTPVARVGDMYYLYTILTSSMLDNGSSGHSVSLSSSAVDYSNHYDFADYQTNHAQCLSESNSMAIAAVGLCNVGELGISVAHSQNNDGSWLATFSVPVAAYKTCANTVTDHHTYIQFDFTVTFPDFVAANNDDCYYFHPQSNTYSYSVQVSTNAETNGVAVKTLDVSLLRCNPSVYIPAYSRLEIVVNISYPDGDIMNVNNPGYLGVAQDNLTETAKNCFGASYAGGRAYCVTTFQSSECRPVIDTEADECVLGRDSSFQIFNMIVESIANGVSQYSTFSPFTMAELFLFPASDCAPPPNVDFVNATEYYAATMSIRNSPNPDWVNADPYLNFDEPITLRIDVGNAGGVTNDGQLQIQMVEYTLRNPVTGEILGHFTFNKADKIRLHKMSWTHFYEDVYFCTHHNNDNTCPDFYEPLSSRMNSYSQNILTSAVLAEVCQTSISTKDNDFFTMTPENWFHLVIPAIEMEVSIIATIELCNGPSRRTLGTRETEEQQRKTVRYIHNSGRFVVHSSTIPIERHGHNEVFDDSISIPLTGVNNKIPTTATHLMHNKKANDDALMSDDEYNILREFVARIRGDNHNQDYSSSYKWMGVLLCFVLLCCVLIVFLKSTCKQVRVEVSYMPLPSIEEKSYLQNM